MCEDEVRVMAFVYLWYVKSTRKFYLGVHNGKDPYYTHSSISSIEFQSIVPGSSKTLSERKDFLENMPKGISRKIIARGTTEEMFELEHKLLKNRYARCWDRYYNESMGFGYIDQWGENNHRYGKKLTEEEKELRRQKSLEMWQIPIEDGGMKGWKPTEEMNRRNSETKKRLYAEGKIVSWIKGKHHTEETKRKIGDKARGRRHSEETKQKMSEQRSGSGNANYSHGLYSTAPIEEQKKHRNAMQKKRRNATDETREAYNKSMREYRARKKAEKVAEEVAKMRRG